MIAPHEQGQALTEYALILVLVVLIVILLLWLFGPAVGKLYSDVLLVI
jgi:Flp pilus assembly pilin Flp